MFLFHYPPMVFYPLLGKIRRNEPETETIDLDSSIGQTIRPLVDSLGANPEIEIMYFPPNHQGVYPLKPRNNAHIYQLVGSSTVGDRVAGPGDVFRLPTPEIIVHSSVYSPCVFAFMSFSASAQQPAMVQPVNELVDQILVVDYVDPEVCKQIIAAMIPRKDGGEYGKVLADHKENRTEEQLHVRRTEMMDSTNRKLGEDMVRDVIVNQVEPFYDQTMEMWNLPALLKYETGGFFLPHVDGEQYRDGEWHRIYDRDYTLIVFLNDDYEGGELTFPDQNYQVTPKQGRVVAFPGDHRFRHGAEMTTKGTRYQLVTWVTAYGTARTRTPPNPNVTYRTW